MNNQEEFNFYVFNIRLLTDRKRTPYTYKALFMEMFWKNDMIAVDKTGSMMFSTMEEGHYANAPVLKGHLCRLDNIENTKWLNNHTDDVEEHLTPDVIYPNYKEIEYVFIPRLHRFCLISRRGEISLSSVHTLLETRLNNVARQDEQVHVTLEKSSDFLEKIMKSSRILNIDVSISCSNQDLNDEYTNLVDNQLRDAEIEYLQIRGRARDGKSVNLQKSEFLKGAAGLVPSNGRASAQIVNRKGEKETVDTSDYPRTFQIRCAEGQKLEKVVRHMMDIYHYGNEV